MKLPGLPQLRNLVRDPRGLLPIAIALIVLGVIAILPTPGAISTVGPRGSKTTEIQPSGTVSSPAIGAESAGDVGGAGKRAGGRASGRGAAGGPGGSSTRFSQGITASTITIGVRIAENFDQASNSLGFKASVGDNRKQAQAVTDYINAHGGMASRKVQLVFAARDDRSSESGHSQEQAACVTFTEDHHVFAAVASLNASADVFVACLAQHNTPVFMQNAVMYDKKTLDTFTDFFYQPSSMNGQRMARIYIDGLVGQGFFQSGAKIGLLRFDLPSYTRVANEALKPSLAAHGLGLTDEIALSGAGDLSATAAQMPNAALRFNQDGITHVLFLDYAANASFLFMPAAESQGYRPRYGLSTYSAPWFNQANSPKAQLSRALGVGWWPDLDVDFERDPGSNSIRKLCLDIMQKAGQNFSDRLAQFAALSYCDLLFFLKTSLDRAGDLTPSGVRAVVDQLGGAYASPLTFGTSFGPGRHDGASAVRNLAFDDGCGCFKYTSGPYPAG